MAEVKIPVFEFINDFCADMKALNEHDYIAEKQSSYFERRKENLKDNEVIAIMDFSENIAFEVQDAVQPHHYAKNQATLHPICMYFKQNGKIEKKSMIIIAESKDHIVESVYLFQTKLAQYVKTVLKKKKIIFFTDGAPSQYKNRKNFLNVCLFKKDFGLDVEWHFFATSHGKSPCDALGGSFKRNARLYNMKHPIKPIDSSIGLYNYSQTIKDSKVHFVHCDKEEYLRVKDRLENGRFNQNIKAVVGSQSYHSFIPTDEQTIEVRSFSDSTKSKKFKML